MSSKLFNLLVEFNDPLYFCGASSHVFSFTYDFIWAFFLFPWLVNFVYCFNEPLTLGFVNLFYCFLVLYFIHYFFSLHYFFC